MKCPFMNPKNIKKYLTQSSRLGQDEFLLIVTNPIFVSVLLIQQNFIHQDINHIYI